MKESKIQALAVDLLRRFGNVEEQFPTPFGRADIVTETTVWEVKKGCLSEAQAAEAASQADRYNRIIGRPNIGLIFPGVADALVGWRTDKKLFEAYPGLSILDPIETAVYTETGGQVTYRVLDSEEFGKSRHTSRLTKEREGLARALGVVKSHLQTGPVSLGDWELIASKALSKDLQSSMWDSVRPDLKRFEADHKAATEKANAELAQSTSSACASAFISSVEIRMAQIETLLGDGPVDTYLELRP